MPFLSKEMFISWRTETDPSSPWIPSVSRVGLSEGRFIGLTYKHEPQKHKCPSTPVQGSGTPWSRTTWVQTPLLDPYLSDYGQSIVRDFNFLICMISLDDWRGPWMPSQVPSLWKKSQREIRCPHTEEKVMGRWSREKWRCWPWRLESESQTGMLAATWNCKRRPTDFLRSPRRECGSADSDLGPVTLISDSHLQDGKTINFYCFKSPGLWQFVVAAMGI